jgi:hypothetical protein
MRVLVLGAGFGGLELTTKLSDALGDEVEVVLIDKAESFVFGFSKLDVMSTSPSSPAPRRWAPSSPRPGSSAPRRPSSARAASSGGSTGSGPPTELAIGQRAQLRSSRARSQVASATAFACQSLLK